MQRFLKYLGRRARPLLRPDWEEEQQAVARMRARLERIPALEDALGGHDAALSQLRDRLDGLLQRDMTQLRKHLLELRRAVLSNVHVTGRALREAEFFSEQATREHSIERLVSRAKRTGRPLVAGPWTGEIGFELLYWIPFLRKMKSRLGDIPLFVVSRGDTSTWYAGIASGYADIFEFTDPDEFRVQTTRETRKQREVGPFDRRLLRTACRSLGVTRPTIIHPSLMYNVMYPYWKDQLAVRRVLEYLQPERLHEAPPAPPTLDLPKDYVAARFYFSQCFPDTPSNRALVADLLRSVAGRMPVILLNTPFVVDDHMDASADIPGVRSIAGFLTPRNNLALQTAVISRARAFIGTYGGFSYLAPLYGVPSLTFYSEPTFFEQHLEFARRTFADVGAGPFLVLHDRERALLDTLLAHVPVS